MILWRAGCPPLFGLRKVERAATQAQDTQCRQANQQIQQALPRLTSVDTVLLVGRWGYYASGQGFGRDLDNQIALHPLSGPAPVGQAQARLMAQAASRTVQDLTRHFDRVMVLRQPPEIPHYDSRDAAREAAHAGWPLAASPTVADSVPRAALTLRTALADAPWVPMAESGTLTMIDPWPMLCDDITCHAVHEGVGQYFDNNHVTNAAALRLRALFAPVFERGERQTALSQEPGQ